MHLKKVKKEKSLSLERKKIKNERITRSAMIINKIFNEEKDLERRQIQNPSLFQSGPHLLPRESGNFDLELLAYQIVH